MKPPRHAPQAIREGRRRLHDMLPRARAMLALGEFSAVSETRLGAKALANVAEDNLDAVMVYPAPKGGWYADIVLAGVPPGMPNAFGTPVASPHRTREEAEENALHMLITVLAGIRDRGHPPEAAPDRLFVLHGLSVPLPARMFDQLALLDAETAALGGIGGGYGSPEAAGRRIDQLCWEMMPEGVTKAGLQTLSDWDQVRLACCLAIATLSGLIRWPERQAGVPPTHAAPETRQ